jgi:hypothetical protein
MVSTLPTTSGMESVVPTDSGASSSKLPMPA